LVGKHERKIPLGRHRCRWEDNIRMDHKEIGWEGVDWVYLAQDTDQWWTVVKVVMNLQVPENAGSFLNSCVIISLTRRTLFHDMS
jgi:hypothetical protein